jgi:hypothetical protein
MKVIIKYTILILCLIIAIISVLCAANLNIGCAIAFVFLCLGNIVLCANTKDN